MRTKAHRTDEGNTVLDKPNRNLQKDIARLELLQQRILSAVTNDRLPHQCTLKEWVEGSKTPAGDQDTVLEICDLLLGYFTDKAKRQPYKLGAINNLENILRPLLPPTTAASQDTPSPTPVQAAAGKATKIPVSVSVPIPAPNPAPNRVSSIVLLPPKKPPAARRLVVPVEEDSKNNWEPDEIVLPANYTVTVASLQDGVAQTRQIKRSNILAALAVSSHKMNAGKFQKFYQDGVLDGIEYLYNVDDEALVGHLVGALKSAFKQNIQVVISPLLDGPIEEQSLEERMHTMLQVFDQPDNAAKMPPHAARMCLLIKSRLWSRDHTD